MFKVLIVEDEMFVRLGIKASIEWNKLGMEVVADAENGLAALEAYETYKPHLILTDIRMPYMDGLQFIEKIREKDGKTKIIILSCLEEFELVRKAMSLGVSDYILKLTMSQGEMEAVLNKVRQELAAELPAKSSPGEDSSFLELSGENVFFNYLLYGTYTDRQFAELVSRLNMQLAPERLILCLMEIDHYEEVQERFSDEQGRLIRFTFTNVVNELLNRYHRGAFFCESNQRYVLLFSFSDIDHPAAIKEQLQEILDHIKRALKTYINCSVSFGVSCIQDGYASLRDLYAQSMNAIQYRYFFGVGETIAHSSINVKAIEASVRKSLQRMFDDLKELRDINWEDIKMELDSFMEGFDATGSQMHRLFVRLGHRALLSMRASSDLLSERMTDYMQNVEHCETLEESILLYKEYLKAVLDVKSGMKGYSKEIVKVIRHIQEHYDCELSLKQLAELAWLSPNYLSSLFKKELGTGLSEYLLKVRMDKARELLANTSLKAYEVALKVGIADESYFSRSFKKMTGVRPNEYKKQWM